MIILIFYLLSGRTVYAQDHRTADRFMDKFDQNQNGTVSRSEYPGSDEAFDRPDANKDGSISETELNNSMKSSGKSKIMLDINERSFYFAPMRTKDDQKKEALFEATVKLVNEIGFASSSVSKIAKEAKVSPSTIYVFFENKEDLLVSTYVELKRKMSDALLDDFDDTLPIRDIIKGVWFSTFKYISNNLEYYDFLEQFANSPYSSLVDKEALEKHFIPIINVMERGIEQKIIKNVDRNLLAAFMFHPISRLANPRLCHGLELSKEDFETAFTMAWDAIKL